ncbi:MAG TPA: MarR family transcriptional regulator [Miltoncostaeaceae bacterium]|nr:MarR family transcriptional regulator [Miltoncostaeaceae bacterium]
MTAQQHRAVQAWVRLAASNAAMTRSFNASLQAGHGLTVNDFEVLRRLSLEPEGRMRRVDLAQVVSLTPSGITRLLDGLERSGLVRKDVCEADGRVTYACITDEGDATLASAARSHLSALEAIFAERYTSEELESLAELLGRLPGAADADEECPSG